MIPKRIHQIWVGPNSIPAHCDAWRQSFIQLNPDFEYTLHGNECIDEFIDNELQRLIDTDTWAWVADRLRVKILKKYGGCYFDVDAICCKPLCEFWESIKDESLVAGRMDSLGVPCDLGGLWAAEDAPELNILIHHEMDTGKSYGRQLLDKMATVATLVDEELWFSPEYTENALVLQMPFRLQSWRQPTVSAGRNTASPKFMLIAVNRKTGQVEMLGSAQKYSSLSGTLDALDMSAYRWAGIQEINRNRCKSSRKG